MAEPPAARIASLLPAGTEIVCALGLGERLVGVSHECDFPPEVRGLPALTSTRIRLERGSGAIDRDVRELVAATLGVFEVDVAALEAARPDLVVTQDLCDVCAVSLDDVRAALDTLGLGRTALVTLHPTRLSDVRADVRRVAAAARVAPAAEPVVAAFDARLEAVRDRAQGLSRPRVLTLEWLEPPMVGGTWMPELVELAGGEPLVARVGERAPVLDRQALATLAPDVVLVKPCGFPLARTLDELEPLRALVAEAGWTAEGGVWLADGNAYFNRPGPRLADSLEILAACVHPESFEDLSRRHAGAFQRLG